MYYNEQLQSLFVQYQKGLFDEYLALGEQAKSGGSMDPLRFEDWCLNTYAVKRRDDERRRNAEEGRQLHALAIRQLKKTEKEAREELEPLVHRAEELKLELSDIRLELAAAVRSQAAAEEKLAEASESLAALDEQLPNMGGTAFVQAMAARNNLEEGVRHAEAALDTATAARLAADSAVSLREREQEGLQKEIEARLRVVADVVDRVAVERIRFSKKVGDEVALLESSDVGLSN